MNRQRLILFVLLVVFALSLGYSYLRMPRQQTVAQQMSAPAIPRSPRDAKKPAPAAANDTAVRLDLLECRQGRFSGFRKNIFSPIFRDEARVSEAPVLPKQVPPPMTLPAPVPPPVPVQPPTAPPEPPPVVRDMARFTFMGFLKKDNRKTVFLTKDKEIILVRQGDKISGKYEATNITDEALTIRVLSDGSEIVIPLMESRPLSVPKR